jgi:hypothetical protein
MGACIHKKRNDTCIICRPDSYFCIHKRAKIVKTAILGITNQYASLLAKNVWKIEN